MNAGATSRRRRSCSSPSIDRIDGPSRPVSESSSMPAICGSIESAEWKRRSRRMAMTSSCRITSTPIADRASQCCCRSRRMTAIMSSRVSSRSLQREQIDFGEVEVVDRRRHAAPYPVRRGWLNRVWRNRTTGRTSLATMSTSRTTNLWPLRSKSSITGPGC